MAYKVIILYRLYMPPYFLGTFTEYPYNKEKALARSPDTKRPPSRLCGGGRFVKEPPPDGFRFTVPFLSVCSAHAC